MARLVSLLLLVVSLAGCVSAPPATSIGEGPVDVVMEHRLEEVLFGIPARRDGLRHGRGGRRRSLEDIAARLPDPIQIREHHDLPEGERKRFEAPPFGIRWPLGVFSREESFDALTKYEVR